MIKKDDGAPLATSSPSPTPLPPNLHDHMPCKQGVGKGRENISRPPVVPFHNIRNLMKINREDGILGPLPRPVPSRLIPVPPTTLATPLSSAITI